MKNMGRFFIYGVLVILTILLLSILPLRGQGDLSGSILGKKIVVPVLVISTKCTSTTGVCGSSSSGAVSIAVAATTVTVATTVIATNSEVFISEDASLATRLGITCNTTLSGKYQVSSRNPGTSFVITTNVAPITNAACLSFFIVN